MVAYPMILKQGSTTVSTTHHLMVVPVFESFWTFLVVVCLRSLLEARSRVQHISTNQLRYSSILGIWLGSEYPDG